MHHDLPRVAPTPLSPVLMPDHEPARLAQRYPFALGAGAHNGIPPSSRFQLPPPNVSLVGACNCRESSGILVCLKRFVFLVYTYLPVGPSTSVYRLPGHRHPFPRILFCLAQLVGSPLYPGVVAELQALCHGVYRVAELQA